MPRDLLMLIIQKNVNRLDKIPGLKTGRRKNNSEMNEVSLSVSEEHLHHNRVSGVMSHACCSVNYCHLKLQKNMLIETEPLRHRQQ